MIKYGTLTIDNYKSIVHATVEFTPGIFSVIGETADGGYSSNGSGKSSILQALTLVLYNKDFQGAPIDTVSNRYTGEPFRVSLTLDVDRGGVQAHYLIINDRASRKLTVLKNGKRHSDTTVKSLKVIQELLGMSEATFKFTHYITTNSILELTKNLSNATLFNEVLQVTELKTMAADLLEVKKRLRKELDEKEGEFKELTGIYKLLKVTNEYNVDDLEDQEGGLKAELRELDGIYAKNVAPVKNERLELAEKLKDLKIELRNKRKSVSEGVCNQCGSSLMTEGRMGNLFSDIENLELTIEDSNKELSEVDFRLVELQTSFDMAIHDITVNLDRVAQDLVMARQLLKIHEDILKSSDKYSEERYKELKKSISYQYKTMDGIDKMRDAIRSGVIYEEVMANFFNLVNTNIQRYREVINFRAYEVEASSYKSGMVAIVKFNGEEIPVESLSNGEKARLSLLLLSALLESMSQVTNSESNFLALDEATSSFDKSGIEELSALFNHLKILEQSVFIITHGSELQNVAFDGTLRVTKNDNLATAEFERK